MSLSQVGPDGDEKDRNLAQVPGPGPDDEDKQNDVGPDDDEDDEDKQNDVGPDDDDGEDKANKSCADSLSSKPGRGSVTFRPGRWKQIVKQGRAAFCQALRRWRRHKDVFTASAARSLTAK